MIQAIFFDIDNTLLDFDAFVRSAMTEGFQRFGFPPYADWMLPEFQRINGRLWREIEDGTLTMEGLWATRWDTVFAALGIAGDGPAFEKFFHRYLFDCAIPVAGAREALEYLGGRGYLLCAASNGPEAQQVNRLRRADFLRYFNHVFTSERLGAQKPAPEFYDRCFAELNADREPPILPEGTLMLGDSLSSDMAGAAAYGMESCLYDPAGTHGDAAPKVNRIIRSLTEVREFL